MFDLKKKIAVNKSNLKQKFIKIVLIYIETFSLNITI